LIAGIIPDEDGRLEARNSILHNFVEAGDARLFGNSIMALVINFKWKSYARRMFLKELIVFVCYLGLFLAFSIQLANTDEALTLNELWQDANGQFLIAASCIIPAFSFRILLREHHQLSRQGGSFNSRILMYTRDPWNIVQLVSALFPLIGCLLTLGRVRKVRIVVAFAALDMWLEVSNPPHNAAVAFRSGTMSPRGMPQWHNVAVPQTPQWLQAVSRFGLSLPR